MGYRRKDFASFSFADTVFSWGPGGLVWFFRLSKVKHGAFWSPHAIGVLKLNVDGVARSKLRPVGMDVVLLMLLGRFERVFVSGRGEGIQ